LEAKAVVGLTAILAMVEAERQMMHLTMKAPH
jgi:hypothetical protein